MSDQLTKILVDTEQKQSRLSDINTQIASLDLLINANIRGTLTKSRKQRKDLLVSKKNIEWSLMILRAQLHELI